jgi:aryl-alcohol dehydrogenase-like predicted oxidoreductase
VRERLLGTSDLRVPAIGQGTAGYGDDAEACARALRLGVDLGMRLVDTAPVYGSGAAEEAIGRALGGIRRQVVLATKFGPEASAPRALVASVEGSLRRLRTDVIDLLQMHWPSYEVPMADTLEAMSRLVQAGKVRHLGLGNCTPAEVRRALATPAGRHVVSVQQEYSLVERTVEDGLLDLCRARGLSLIAYTPLGGGRLAADAGGTSVLRAVAEAHAATVPQVMLAWLVRDPRVIAIPKAGREAHVRENAAAGALVLGDDEHARIAAAFRVDTRRLAPDQVAVEAEAGRAVYTTLAEARANRLGIVPGPAELAATMRDGELLKPIKVRAVRDGGATRFRLVDGRTRYWAWVIAHGNAPIPAIVTTEVS